MRPTNDSQRNILRLYGKLPLISEAQLRWAKMNAHSRSAIDNGHTKCCTACGHRFKSEAREGESAKCPQCGCELKVLPNKKQCVYESYYFHIVTTIGGFQVVRNWIANRRIRRKGMEFDAYEATCSFIDAKGKETCLGRKRTTFFWQEHFSRDSEMEIRRISRNSYYGNHSSYHPCGYVYPRAKFLPMLRRNGMTLDCDTINAATLCSMLLSDPYYEMLVKNKQYSLVAQSWHKGEHIYPHAVRIANRRKFIIEDASLWHDYIADLEFLGYDTHNPKYVCPEDLHAAHQWSHAKRRRIEEEQRRKEALEETAKHEARYEKEKGAYFGVCFGNEDIVITTIRSVAEMAMEGEEMHHCVYDNKYYQKAESLILSARDKNDNRLETIEISLKDYSVVQSRGKYNKNTPQHDEILRLVRENINKIKHPRKMQEAI